MATLIYSFYSGTILKKWSTALFVNMVLINFNLLTVVKLEMEVVSDFFPFSSPCSHLDVTQLLQLGVILDRRVVFYILPVVSYVLLYSKLPHKVLLHI